MGLLTKVFAPVIIPLCFLFFSAAPAFSSTDAKAQAILDKMDSARHPEGLKGFNCTAHIELSTSPNPAPRLIEPSGLPDVNPDIQITYIAPYDFRVEYSGPYNTGASPRDFARLRGDDPLTLANPALKRELLAVYGLKSAIDGYHNGEECHVLHLIPTDSTKGLMPFDLYIRESDYLPIYTELQISAARGNIFFRTEIEYSEINGFQVTDAITTKVEFTDLTGFVYKTVFSEYEINPTGTVLLGGQEKTAIEQDEPDDDPFANIYHGFEDPLMVVKLGGDNALYGKLRFAFALEVPSRGTIKELEKRRGEISAAVCSALDGRSWGDIKDRSYEIGLELMDIINGELTTGKVTDFYFTIFNAER